MLDETVVFGTLLEALGSIPDSRKPRGVRFPQGSLLSLCVLAFICGAQNLSQIRRFARDHPDLLALLGFRKKTPPSVPTLSRVLGAVSISDLQRALSGWLGGVVSRVRADAAIASVDGKACRASHCHVLNVFLHDLEMIIWAVPVSEKKNEISAFKQDLERLLAAYPFLQLIVGDAMFSGEPLCRDLIENGRHYLFQIKADQPHLLEKMEIVFSPFLSRPTDSTAFSGEKKRALRSGARKPNA